MKFHDFIVRKRTSNMRSKTNMAIRQRCIEKDVHITDIAAAIGISDSAMYTRMRRELPEEDQQQIIALVDQIAAERGGSELS